MYSIFVASDGTGRTAEQALQAALTQFSDVEVRIKVIPNVRTLPKVRKVVQDAKKASAFIVHTLVGDSIRGSMIRECRHHNVETFDLMGSLLARLADQFAATPVEKPGLFNQLNRTYFRRIETMEFAIRHDDGQRANELRKAEIVLVGVSRTFKTPLSIYLAFKGWYVANVPIMLGVEPPSSLFKLRPGRVFCLNTSPRQLAELRRSRQEYLSGAVDEYADPEHVRMELMHARRIFNRNPDWQIVSIVSKPIEEIASEILAIREKSARKGSRS